jgi:hypothetical protein
LLLVSSPYVNKTDLDIAALAGTADSMRAIAQGASEAAEMLQTTINELDPPSVQVNWSKLRDQAAKRAALDEEAS